MPLRIREQAVVLVAAITVALEGLAYLVQAVGVALEVLMALRVHQPMQVMAVVIVMVSPPVEGVELNREVAALDKLET